MKFNNNKKKDYDPILEFAKCINSNPTNIKKALEAFNGLDGKEADIILKNGEIILEWLPEKEGKRLEWITKKARENLESLKIYIHFESLESSVIKVK